MVLGSMKAPAFSSDDEMADFMLQDVCVDANNNALPIDPIQCGAHARRNAALGEEVPYFRLDGSGMGKFSVPLRARDGRTIISHSYQWGRGLGKHIRDNDAVQDGYDLAETDGTFFSLMATKDPSQTIFFFNANCATDDAWLTFPRTLARGTTGNIATYIASGESCNPSSLNQSFSYWNYYANPLTYSSGKSLQSVVSWHLGTFDPTQNDHMEVYYHTKEYGHTRWEAWDSRDGCLAKKAQRIPGFESCEPDINNCNGPTTTTLFGVNYFRKFCRDWSLVTIPESPFQPSSHPLTIIPTSTNVLTGSDFASGKMGNWSRFEVPGQGSTHWRQFQDTTFNHKLEVTCTAPCTSNSVGLAGSAATVGAALRTVIVSGLLNGPANTYGTMAVQFIGTDGSIQSRTMRIRFEGKEKLYQFHLLWDFASRPIQTLKWDFYMETAGVLYTIDEANIAAY